MFFSKTEVNMNEIYKNVNEIYRALWQFYRLFFLQEIKLY